MNYTIDDARNEWLDPDNWESCADPIDPINVTLEVVIDDFIECDEAQVKWKGGDADDVRLWAEDLTWGDQCIFLKSAQSLSEDMLDTIAPKLPEALGTYQVHAKVLISFTISQLYLTDDPDCQYFTEDVEVDETGKCIKEFECTRCEQ